MRLWSGAARSAFIVSNQNSFTTCFSTFREWLAQRREPFLLNQRHVWMYGCMWGLSYEWPICDSPTYPSKIKFSFALLGPISLFSFYFAACGWLPFLKSKQQCKCEPFLNQLPVPVLGISFAFFAFVIIVIIWHIEIEWRDGNVLWAADRRWRHQRFKSDIQRLILWI